MSDTEIAASFVLFYLVIVACLLWGDEIRMNRDDSGKVFKCKTVTNEIFYTKRNPGRGGNNKNFIEASKTLEGPYEVHLDPSHIVSWEWEHK